MATGTGATAAGHARAGLLSAVRRYCRGATERAVATARPDAAAVWRPASIFTTADPTAATTAVAVSIRCCAKCRGLAPVMSESARANGLNPSATTVAVKRLSGVVSACDAGNHSPAGAPRHQSARPATAVASKRVEPALWCRLIPLSTTTAGQTAAIVTVLSAAGAVQCPPRTAVPARAISPAT